MAISKKDAKKVADGIQSQITSNQLEFMLDTVADQGGNKSLRKSLGRILKAMDRKKQPKSKAA